MNLGLASVVSFMSLGRKDYYSGSGDEPEPDPVEVFISYSHHDTRIAQRLKDELQAEGFVVTIDSESLSPGQSIESFIERSVRAADATVSILSRFSLLSAWVARESVEAHSYTGKKFIGCFVDDSFLRRDFVDDAFDHADSQLLEVSTLIKNRLDMGRDFRELSDDLGRWRLLRANIDEIVRRFRSTACVDLRPRNFKAGLQSLVSELND